MARSYYQKFARDDGSEVMVEYEINPFDASVDIIGAEPMPLVLEVELTEAERKRFEFEAVVDVDSRN